MHMWEQNEKDMADTNVFMRPTEICRAKFLYHARLYNVYGGVRETTYHTKKQQHNTYIDCEHSTVYVGLAQAHPN